MPNRQAVVMFLANVFHIDTRVRQEAKSLVDAKYSVFVLAWDREREYGSVEIVEGAVVHSFAIMNLRKFSVLGLALGAVIFQILLFLGTLKLIRRIRQRPIVHVHDFNTLVPACVLQLMHLALGVVYDTHELSPEAYTELFGPALGRIIATIERACLGYVDTTITVSRPIADYYRKLSRRTEILYNCPRAADIPRLSKPEARRQLGLPLDAFIVSYVGIIRYDCRLDLLLRAATSMSKIPSVRFLVVGGGPSASEFRKAAEQTRAYLTLVPMVPPKRALLYVYASDLTWAIYRSDSLNQRLTVTWKFFESLACGVPVMVQSGTFSAELAKRLRCGPILERQDPDLVCELIASVADKRQTFPSSDAQALGYTWEEMSHRLTAVYDELVTLKRVK
jgi:glycosyltransferase involved in cell wall biosynthesis